MEADLEPADEERPQRVFELVVLPDERATQAALGGNDLEEVRELLTALVDKAHDALAASAPAISDCVTREP